MFVIDSKVENWLTQMGVPYKYVQNLRFDQLVPNWEAINQGRPDGVPKDDDIILQYASAQSQPGAAFPAPILGRAADGLEVLDGIQRLSAALLNDHKVFNAYVIESDNPGIRASVRICSNSILNGRPPSQEWTVSRVIDVLYEQHRLSPTDCSMWSGIHLNRINDEIGSRDGALWMKANGIDMTLKPANQKGFQSAFSKRFPMAERERCGKELVKIIKSMQDYRATNKDVDDLFELFTDFKPQKGVPLGSQLNAKFEEVISRPEIKARMMGRRKLSPIEDVQRAVASAVTVMRKAAEGEHTTDKTEAGKIVELVTQVRDLARKIVPKDEWSGPLGYGPQRQ